MDVELRHLRAFTAVATHRSFTAASRELLIGQPALTRTVQQLEAALGVRLLERTSRSVQLTDVGQDFLDRTGAVLADLDRAILAARGQQELRLGFQWVLPDPWVTETITGFEQATGVTVTLLRRDDIDTALEAGDLDVAITRTRLTASGTVQTPLFDEDRVAAVSTRSPLAEREHIDWLDLPAEPVVVNTVSGTTQPDSWPAEYRPTRVVTCGNYDEWLQLIATGRGVGAVPRSAARTGTHPGVTFVPLTGAPPVSVCLAYRPAAVIHWCAGSSPSPRPQPPLSPCRSGGRAMPSPASATWHRNVQFPTCQGCRRRCPMVSRSETPGGFRAGRRRHPVLSSVRHGESATRRHGQTDHCSGAPVQ